MYKLGLIGNPLDHSFSKKYFDNKFRKEKINNFSYKLYPIKNINQIDTLILENQLIGLNVTSPYKSEVIQYLDKIEETAQKINSINTIFIHPKTNKKYGFNTDIIGFEETLKFIQLEKNDKALILGSGSVSKTITYCLKKQKIKHLIVSRNPQNKMINYSQISNFILNVTLIINTTPVGQYPNPKQFPKIPYQHISDDHCCIDLVYNPEKTLFLEKCKKKGAKIINGGIMLQSQADASWEIWNKLIIKYNV